MKTIVNKVILLVLSILFIWIFSMSFIYDSNVHYSQNKIISLLFALLFLGIWYIFYKILLKKNIIISKKKKILLFMLYIVIITIIQIIVIKFLEVKPYSDPGIIYDNVLYFIKNGNRTNVLHKEYFQLFPNNILIFIIGVLFSKIGSIFGLQVLTSLYITNAIFIDLALIILMLTINKIYDFKLTLLAMFISLFFLPIYFYAPIYYSDTMSLFIPISFVYLYTCFKTSMGAKKNLILMTFGFLLFLGVQIKITSIIIFIAILFDYILNLDKIKNIISITIPITTFIILTILFNITIVKNPIFDFKQNDWGKYPYTHWIMMGVEDIDANNSFRNAYGGYSFRDYKLTDSFNTGSEAVKFHLEEYSSRVKKMGFFGYLNYLTKKAVNAWSDGTYFTDIALKVNSLHRKELVYNFLFVDHKYFYINFCQGFQFAFFIILIIGSIKQFNKKTNHINYLKLSIIGLLLFFLIWENRSRYLYNYIPIFILIIAEFYYNLMLNKNK